MHLIGNFDEYDVALAIHHILPVKFLFVYLVRPYQVMHYVSLLAV